MRGEDWGEVKGGGEKEWGVRVREGRGKEEGGEGRRIRCKISRSLLSPLTCRWTQQKLQVGLASNALVFCLGIRGCGQLPHSAEDKDHARAEAE